MNEPAQPIEAIRTANVSLDLVRRLGCGAMGDVFFAELHGVEGFLKPVAVKRIHPHLLDGHPNARARFIREARLSALLKHPNIVQTLQFFEDHGQLYLVMEYVNGLTLAKALRAFRETGKPVPCSVGLQIVSQLLEGLHHAHTATDVDGRPLHIVHRDIKPSNIILDKEGGLTKILDFGVAHSTIGETLTGHGDILGTIAYMAPELVSDAPDIRIDHRADLFSAGTILFEVLTGERLYDAPNAAALLYQVDRAEVAGRIATLPDIPARPYLVAFLTKALAADPDQRYQTGEEMADALRQIERHASPYVPLEKWLRNLEPVPPRVSRPSSAVALDAFSLDGDLLRDALADPPSTTLESKERPTDSVSDSDAVSSQMLIDRGPPEPTSRVQVPGPPEAPPGKPDVRVAMGATTVPVGQARWARRSTLPRWIMAVILMAATATFGWMGWRSLRHGSPAQRVGRSTPVRVQVQSGLTTQEAARTPATGGDATAPHVSHGGEYPNRPGESPGRTGSPPSEPPSKSAPGGGLKSKTKSGTPARPRQHEQKRPATGKPGGPTSEKVRDADHEAKTLQARAPEDLPKPSTPTPSGHHEAEAGGQPAGDGVIVPVWLKVHPEPTRAGAYFLIAGQRVDPATRTVVRLSRPGTWPVVLVADGQKESFHLTLVPHGKTQCVYFRNRPPGERVKCRAFE